jgi:hypothetical protein
MKYIHLLVSSLALSLCSYSNLFDNDSSNESKLSSETVNVNVMVGITSLPQDVLRYLNNFLGIREQFYFKNLNRFTREALNMKDRVEKTFKISGLESVADNEPELAGVMRLAWTSHDPFLFFAGLLVDFISGKKPYKVINRPLLLHLVRTLPEYEQKCGILNQSEFLPIMCSRKGQFDLVFELFRGYPDLLKNREIFGQFENGFSH